MSFRKFKITAYETSIAGLPDRVQGKAAWLKKQFDARTDREVKEQHNALCDALEVFDGEMKQNHEEYTAHSKDNVRHITAAERESWNDKYTKAEIDAREAAMKTAQEQHEKDYVRHITPDERSRWNALSQLPPGTGDMETGVYDSNLSGVVDDAERLGGCLPEYYAAASSVKVFSCTFRASAWQQKGSEWVQTAPCPEMQAEFDCEPPGTFITSVPQMQAAEIVLRGKLRTAANGIEASVTQRPEEDLEIFMRRMEKDTRAQSASGKEQEASAGRGNMRREIYDQNMNGIVDDAERLAGRPPSYYAAASSVKVFSCTFRASAWQQRGNEWVQTALCPGMKEEFDCGECMCSAETAQQEKAAEIVLSGQLRTAANGISATVTQRPEADIELLTRRIAEKPDIGEISPSDPMSDGNFEEATSEEIDAIFKALETKKRSMTHGKMDIT